MRMTRIRQPGLLLGEWACLGVLTAQRAHGFAVAKRLAASGDIGRVWSLSRPLTYRALDMLVELGMIRAVAEERGAAGPNRMVLGATPKGRRALRAWLHQPVGHLRDVRGELLLKLLVSDINGVDAAPLVAAQLRMFAALHEALMEQSEPAGGQRLDPVAVWRQENADAAVRFLSRLSAPPPH